ncbi:MAG: alpha/beta hydrolase [Cyanobacteria bacterium]|nr:alpha/beta hydrolase [Cyanobacteriota bacterium]
MSAAEAAALQVIAMHGWCGEASHWQPWRRRFATAHWHWQSGERGYGSAEPQLPTWLERAGRRVLIGHSLGPHLLPPELWAEAEAVVLLAGFGRFVPAGPPGRRLRRALSTMERQLDNSDSARAMLSRFLCQAAAPDPVELSPSGPLQGPLGPAQLLRLRRDLQLLSNTEGLPTGFPHGAPVLVVEAAQDQIVTPEARELLRQELPRAELVSLPDAGHSLLSAPVLPLVLPWLQRTLAP